MITEQQSPRCDGAPSPAGMILREREPLNLEMPFGSIAGPITPVDHFFVRNHFPVPNIDVQSWRLGIDGEVERPLRFSYDAIRAMESRTLSVTMECAGNGRAFLTPRVHGTPWERGAVGNAEWTGVPLTDVLRLAGLKICATEVIFEGADQGEIKEPLAPAGAVHYARSMPLRNVTSDVLLAFQMNGSELTPAHGSPLRVIVPGWYGMASVKWLNRIIASARSFNGYYQTLDYAYWETGPTAPTLVPITEMLVKAQIARPGNNEVLHAGRIYHVHGAAWTSDAEVIKVQISADGGCAWHDTRLLGVPTRYAWRLWDYEWMVPATPGKVTLMVRAEDSKGRTQCLQRDRNCRSYMVNHLLPLEVDVR